MDKFCLPRDINGKSLLEHYMEQQEKFVTIHDLYSPEELDDTEEVLYHFVDPKSTDKYKVFMLSTAQLKHLKTPIGDTTIIKNYEANASKHTQKLVKQKKAKFDDNRIIVLKGNKVIDGNHQIVAAIQMNKSVKAIDLNQPVR